MTMPGPTSLGRSVVVTAGTEPPAPWSGCETVTVDPALLSDPEALAATVDRLHRSWAARTPLVIASSLDDAELGEPQVERREPWQVGAEFTFLRERLHFLVWANAYDARRDPPVWWWGRKAEQLGARRGGAADVVLPDGREVWIDGGPRGPVTGLGHPFVHAESVRLGRLEPRAAEPEPPGGLASDQIQAVLHGAGPARIIAPAGSGKTRTLVARLRHLLATIEPELVCALAYNTRAAREMRERLGDRRVSVRTIHSIGWEILRDSRGDVRLLEEREVRARLDGLVPGGRRPNTDVIGPYLEALGEVRAALRPPSAVESSRDDVPDFATVYRRYRRLLHRRKEADFEEQVYGAVEALFADPELRRRWQARCRHLLVDEFQDLTPAYVLLIRLLASPELDVFGVGDDDQTIYGYAGADPAYLIDFDRLFPGADTHPLHINYRCPAPVVEAATRLLVHNRRRVDKTINPRPGAPTDPATLRVRELPAAEVAAGTADEVATAAAEVGPGSVAVLSRVNSALLPVHAALADRAIGFQSPLGPHLLRRTLVVATLAWLRLAGDPTALDREDLLAAVRRPSRGLNRIAGRLLDGRRQWELRDLRRRGASLEGRQATRWEAFCDDLELVAGRGPHTDLGELFGILVDTVGLGRAAHALDAGRTRADRAAQADDLVALRRCAALHPDLDGFEGWLKEVLQHPRDTAGVTLSTIHRVKGMEWDRVVVFGAERGLLPHDLAADDEEERRVFHVALTRARKGVVAIAEQGRVSPFVAEMEGRTPVAVRPAVEDRPRRRTPRGGGRRVAVRVGATMTVPGGHRGRVREVDQTGAWVEVGSALLHVGWGEEVAVGAQRGRLAPPEEGLTPDPELLERLRAWRSEVAGSRGFPAYVVMHDRTLEAIAATRPTSEEALRAIPGIGPAKLEAYGDDLVAICSDAP